MPNLSTTTLFSSAARDDALVNRRLNEMPAFREIADYAMRRHALALPMVRAERQKQAGKPFDRGQDYLAGIQAGRKRSCGGHGISPAQSRLSGFPSIDKKLYCID